MPIFLPSTSTLCKRWLRAQLLYCFSLHLGTCVVTGQDATRCNFNGTDDKAIARCALRYVKPKAHLGATLASLPEPLDALVGQESVDILPNLKTYLAKKKIAVGEVGGELTPIADVRFFIIHDTSTPNYKDKEFPADIDSGTWSGNDLKKTKAVAHIFVNRIGESISGHNFNVPWRATKFESSDAKWKGKFVHVELIQPRRSGPGPKDNDFVAPMPGFTAVQLDRLALLYIVASARRGHWLIPGFHCAVDAGLPDGHDDPQNFDLPDWTTRLKALLGEVSASK